MTALLYIISALVLGAGIWRWLRLPSYAFEAVAISCLLGLFGWIWLAFVLSLLLPYAISLPAATAIGLILGSWLWLRRGRFPVIRPLPGGRAGRITWSVATAILIFSLGLLSWTHDLKPESSGLYSGAATWADFGVHSSLITHFAATGRLPLDLPVASGVRLTYPFLIDLLSSFYYQGGWNLHLAIFIPSLLLIWSILQLFIGLSLRFFNRLSAALLGLGLFLSGGAIAGLDAAWSDWRHSGLGLGQFLAAIPRDYTSIDQLNLHFNNIVADSLLPQRGYLFGLGLLLLILILLFTDRQDHHPRWRLTTAVIIGLLPLAHAHTFIIAMAILVTLAAADIWHHRSHLKSWIIPISLSIALAALQLAWQQLANGLGTGGHFAPGWLVQPGQSIWQFWWQNFGFFGLYALALPALLIIGGHRRYLIWYLPFAGLLVLSQLYAFQPFAYDNLKLILSAYLICCLFAGWHLITAIRTRPSLLVFFIPIILLSTLPGALTIAREFQLHDQFASTDDLAVATWARTSTPPSSLFLATDRPNQPVTALAGRSAVLGYRGWLYSYHLPYNDRVKAVTLALEGQTGHPDVTRFGAQYLLIGRYEGPEWTVNRDKLATQHPIRYQNPSWIVYQLR